MRSQCVGVSLHTVLGVVACLFKECAFHCTKHKFFHFDLFSPFIIVYNWSMSMMTKRQNNMHNILLLIFRLRQ